MSKTRTALIIGGGIAGPVAALALRKVGVEATVYEAYPESNGIGGGLGLASNGLAALELVDAADAVRAISSSFPTMYMSINGKRAGVAATLNGEEPLQLVQRGDLHKALHDVAVASGVRVEYGKRLVDADERPDGVTARFADGGTASADILIGADGIRSTVRTLIDPQAPGPKWTGTIGFGAYDLDVSDVPDIDIEPSTGCFAFGKRAYYLYWRYPDGRIAWGANLPWKQYLSITEARAVPRQQWIDVFRETYAGDIPGEQMVRALKPESLDIQGSLHIMPPVPHWHRGRMVLIGDSVHAPSNSSGQGASLAIESAIELARALRDLPDPESAFATYEQLRRARVEKIAKAAARVNHAKAPGPVAKVLMRAIMPIMFSPRIVEKSNGPALRHRIAFEDSIPDAVRRGARS